MAAIGAATAFAATALPSLRPCGDDAPALLPGSLPVSPLRIPISDLHSLITMSGGQVLAVLKLYSLFPVYPYAISLLLLVGIYIYDDT